MKNCCANQGVTFNSSWSGNVLTLQIDAAKPTGDWSKANGLAALEIDGIGNYNSVSVTSAPGGTGSWLTSSSQLTGQGCDGGSNGQAGSRLCFYGQQIGLADKIIDVVDTGNTLRANGLEPQDFIADISSRLIVNKASMKMQHARIQALIDTLRKAVESRHRG